MSAVTLYCVDGTPFLVDEEDAPVVGDMRWYALRNPKSRTTYVLNHHTVGRLHRWLLAAPSGVFVDHIDSNALNNCRSNLRLASRSQNQHNGQLRRNNTSGVKGVSWSKASGKWLAQIFFMSENHYLGLFDDLAEATKAVEDARVRLHGEFARHS